VPFLLANCFLYFASSLWRTGRRVDMNGSRVFLLICAILISRCYDIKKADRSNRPRLSEKEAKIK
jgi:hypothetical protein